jgi:hypothetical protein
MAANGQVVSVGATATLIFQVLDGNAYNALVSPAANIFKCGTNNDPLPILLIFASTNTIYLGGSGVTSSSTGIGALATGITTLTYNAVGDDSLYGIVASSTQAVQLLVLRQ